MARITAQEVQKLRLKTGLSMMECKKALEETGGDLEEAENFLRKKLKGKMDTRTERAAGEGRLGIKTREDGKAVAIIEVRAETDFTAKNENFVNACERIAEIALQGAAGKVEPNEEVQKLIDEIRISTGENCSFARGIKMEGDLFGTYLHHDGKTGVVTEATGNISAQQLSDVCMHITAAHPTPLGVTREDIPAEAVEKERKFRLEQAMESGKPEEIAQKMVEGGMRKFFEEVALLEQPFIKDPSKTIKEVIGDKGTIVRFVRWQVGQESA